MMTSANHEKKLGRPLTPPEKKRSEVLRVRVTPSEADSLYRLAIRRGEPLTHVLRSVLVRLIHATEH